MRRAIAEVRKLVKEIRRVKVNSKMLNMINMVVAGAVLIGFGLGAVPEWMWIPLVIYFGVGFLYPIFDDNRKSLRKQKKKAITRP